MLITWFSQCQVGIIITTAIVQMRKLRLREIHKFTQGLKAPKWPRCVGSALFFCLRSYTLFGIDHLMQNKSVRVSAHRCPYVLEVFKDGVVCRTVTGKVGGWGFDSHHLFYMLRKSVQCGRLSRQGLSRRDGLAFSWT